MEIAEDLGDQELLARASIQYSLHLYFAGCLREAFAIIQRSRRRIRSMGGESANGKVPAKDNSGFNSRPG
jgi:hypothetical protein